MANKVINAMEAEKREAEKTETHGEIEETVKETGPKASV